MQDVPALVRQWTLLRMLSARRHGMTLADMAHETGVVQRTILRDLQMLRQIGFPILNSVGDHGRKHWHIDSPNGQPPLTFNFAEVAALYLAERFLEPLTGTPFWDGAQTAFKKFRATLGEPALKYLDRLAVILHQTTLGTGDYSNKRDIIDGLMVGIEDRKITFVTYQSMRSTEPTTYDVYPYALVFHRRSMYLVAFAPEHNEIRHYKVDRISGVELQDLRFVADPNFDVKQHFADSFGIYRGNGKGVTVKVRFLPEVARYVRESQWHPSQELTEQKDGSLIATFRLGDTEEIKRWILSFGRNAIVLEPKRLREDVREEIRAMGASYGARNARAVPRKG